MARTFTANDGLEPADMFHSAHDHATAAAALAGASASHLDSAGYLAHMAVELALKAWLLQVAKRFPGIHSLSTLYKDLQEYGARPLSDQQTTLLATLDDYEELRYPNRKEPTEVGQEELALLPDFMEFLYQSYPGALQEAIAKLDPLAKGGRVLMRKKIDTQAASAKDA